MSNFTQFIGGGSVKLWSSGETVLKWDYRKSPIDGEIYQRITATGSGTTDPANDGTNYSASSFTRSGYRLEVPPIASAAAGSAFLSTTVVRFPGAFTGGVRTQILSGAGRGRCSFLSFIPVMTEASCRIEVIADGRTVYDYTQSVGGTNPYIAQMPIGAVSTQGSSTTSFTALPDALPVVFRRSFEVWVTPSITTSGNSRLFHQLRGEA